MCIWGSQQHAALSAGLLQTDTRFSKRHLVKLRFKIKKNKTASYLYLYPKGYWPASGPVSGCSELWRLKTGHDNIQFCDFEVTADMSVITLIARAPHTGRASRRLQNCTCPVKKLPHTCSVYLCVLFRSQNKLRLFPYTTLIDWFL